MIQNLHCEIITNSSKCCLIKIQHRLSKHWIHPRHRIDVLSTVRRQKVVRRSVEGSIPQKKQLCQDLGSELGIHRPAHWIRDGGCFNNNCQDTLGKKGADNQELPGMDFFVSGIPIVKAVCVWGISGVCMCGVRERREPTTKRERESLG